MLDSLPLSSAFSLVFSSPVGRASLSRASPVLAMSALSLPTASRLLLSSSLFLLLSLFPLPTSSTFFTPLCNSTATEPCDAPTPAPWNPRSEHFTFYYHGAVWIAGGLDVQAVNNGPGTVYLNDVWGSYDLGRRWVKAAGTLPGICTSSTAQATVYDGSVYLTCDNPAGNAHFTVVSSSPTLASFTTLAPVGTDDGLGFRVGMSVNRMAVPFDGIGTLVLLGGNTGVDNNDVWTLSATGNFDESPINRWHRFMDRRNTSAPYLSPWLPRTAHMTTVDAEGLVLILMGGNSETATQSDMILNDVWQLSWIDGQTNPLWYQLLAAAPWPARKLGVVWHVMDFLWLYAGSDQTGDFINGNPISQIDDVWRSGDYGASWQFVSGSGTGQARHGLDPLVVGRRFYVIGGSNGIDANAAITPPTSYFNDGQHTSTCCTHHTHALLTAAAHLALCVAADVVRSVGGVLVRKETGPVGKSGSVEEWVEVERSCDESGQCPLRGLVSAAAALA